MPISNLIKRDFNIMRILFDSKKTEYKSVFGTLEEAEGCEFNIKIPVHCQTTNVFLVFEEENGKEFCRYAMFKKEETQGYERYSCTLSFALKGLYFYYFHIQTELGAFPLYKEGYDQTNMHVGDKWQLSVIPRDFNLPERFYGRVMYQIFPDRFYHSKINKAEGKLTPYSLHESVKEVPEYRPNEQGEITNSDFYGGNLAGITQKLDYLKSMGVGVIYLNPIFKAYSNHRYDTCDYRKIDELLGDEKDFANLCKEAHKRDIFVILDGVFSHTGKDSIYFDGQNRFGQGAYNNPDSPYIDWYDFQNYPDEYTSWWGISTLPCVNELSESYIKYQITDKDSTLNKWMSLGADGWRLDVADELPEDFIRIMRATLKKNYPDALLLGEVWEDASNKISYSYRRHYFLGEELDSVMNYPFRNAIISFVTGHDDGYAFRDTVMSIAENYPDKILPLLMNFLSTHDTPRIFTLLGEGDARTKDEKATYRLSPEQEHMAVERLYCGTVLQYILPGMPSIFYGDEIFTPGFEDPFCRGYFDWDKKEGMGEFLSRLGKMRNNKALITGNVWVDILTQGVIRVERQAEAQTVTLILNCSGEDYGAEEEINTAVLTRNTLKDGQNNIIQHNGFAIFVE